MILLSTVHLFFVDNFHNAVCQVQITISVTGERREIRALCFLKSIRIARKLDRQILFFYVNKVRCAFTMSILCNGFKVHIFTDAIISNGFFNCFKKFCTFCYRIFNPIRRPYAIDLPSHILQNVLPQTISFSCSTSRMICCSITFNAKHIDSTKGRMLYSHINSITRTSYLSTEAISFSVKKIVYCFLKRRVMFNNITFGYFSFKNIPFIMN